MRVDELDYDLPEGLIAQRPAASRDGSRLLVLAGGDSRHHHIRDLPELLKPSLIVLNDTRVIPARLFGHKSTGGRVELLLLEPLDAGATKQRWRALGRASKGLEPGTRLQLEDPGLTAVVEARGQAGELSVLLAAEDGVQTTVERSGHVPLPPYIRRADDGTDRERYQTVYARQPGAVAAPTAGLHFTRRLLDTLSEQGHEIAYLTLHVGPGTFAPVRAETLEGHPMHTERYFVPPETARAIGRARQEGRPVLAVGTTVVRTLEAAHVEGEGVQAGSGSTSIFIRPPFRFRVVDQLLTNFHLPRSTLLALVMALGGVEQVRQAYRAAVDAGYRFYSYGDAMLVGPQS